MVVGGGIVGRLSATATAVWEGITGIVRVWFIRWEVSARIVSSEGGFDFGAGAITESTSGLVISNTISPGFRRIFFLLGVIPGDENRCLSFAAPFAPSGRSSSPGTGGVSACFSITSKLTAFSSVSSMSINWRVDSPTIPLRVGSRKAEIDCVTPPKTCRLLEKTLWEEFNRGLVEEVLLEEPILLPPAESVGGPPPGGALGTLNNPLILGRGG